MTQYEFDKLSEKYLQGNCTLEEELLLEEWSKRQLSTVVNPLSEKETIKMKKELWGDIKDSVELPPLSILRFSWFRLGLAATFLILISIGYTVYKKGVFQSQNTEIASQQKGIETTNNNDKPQLITLNDGTTVTLQPRSSLIYPEKFGNSRTVYLKGEGYFKVKRDTTKPFYVYAGNLITKVLGTSFYVKTSNNGKKTEVVVTSGKVAVYENIDGKIGKSVVLNPNLKVIQTDKQLMTPQLVEQPVVVNPIEKAEDFNFKESPLPVVLATLTKVYSVDIFFKNKNSENCFFSGNLNGLNLDEQLNLICQSIRGRYQKYETAIWIEGDECQ